MTARDIIRLVAGREIRDRIRNRAFVLGTGADIGLAFDGDADELSRNLTLLKALED